RKRPGRRSQQLEYVVCGNGHRRVHVSGWRRDVESIRQRLAACCGVRHRNPKCQSHLACRHTRAGTLRARSGGHIHYDHLDHDHDPILPPPNQNTNDGSATLLVGWFSPFNPHLTATRLLGTLSVPVPATAQGGQMYRLRIIAPSGTSDGSTDVPIAPGPDGKLTVGRRFLVCDVVPTRTDQNGDGDTADAGEFGNGTIGNADVVAIFRASLLPDQQPPAGSDLFSAMDCSPEDAPPVCGGDATI